MTINFESVDLGAFASNLSYIGVGAVLGIAATIGVVAYWLKHPEVVDKWIGMVAGWLGGMFGGLEKFSMKREFQGRVNAYLKHLENHTTIDIPRLTIRFTKHSGESEDFVWEENGAIIVMHDKKHKTRNFIHATHFYTTEVLLRRSKRHLSKTQKEALDLFSTQEVLKHTYRSAEEQFVSDYVVPSIERNDDIRALFSQFDSIAKKGLYFAILIQELTSLGQKVFHTKPTAEVITEVKSLIDFLNKYSLRKDRDTTVLEDFWGKYMRCAVKIVASTASRERGNTNGHRERICRAVNNGFENVYIIGANTLPNRGFMSRVVRAVIDECPHIEEGERKNLQGRIRVGHIFKNVDTYFIPLHNPNAVKYIYSDEDLTDVDPIADIDGTNT